eukprot:14317675-Heterocapsa_arctica.AAC.1
MPAWLRALGNCGGRRAGWQRRGCWRCRALGCFPALLALAAALPAAVVLRSPLRSGDVIEIAVVALLATS